MPIPLVFGINVLMGLLVWSIAVALYLWPVLRRLPRADALRPLLLLHSFRFMGLAFIVPGVVSPDLPAAFARPDAYGDLIAAILALIALAALRTRAANAFVWVFGVWGSLDLINAFYQGGRHALAPGQLGATYFIVTFFVPLLLITHALVFRLLLRRDDAVAAQDRRLAA
jgi:hypothetical protein